MLDNVDLSGSSWAGLIVCPGNLSFTVTLSFDSKSNSGYSGSFIATGVKTVEGSFTATRTANGVTFLGSSGGWAKFTCNAGLAAVDGAHQFALSGFVMAGSGNATSGVLTLFNKILKDDQPVVWDALRIKK
jgi:hypothetical protein